MPAKRILLTALAIALVSLLVWLMRAVGRGSGSAGLPHDFPPTARENEAVAIEHDGPEGPPATDNSRELVKQGVPEAAPDSAVEGEERPVFEGTVLDRSDRPVADAQVLLSSGLEGSWGPLDGRGMSDPLAPRLYSTESDADGRFRLVGPAEGVSKIAIRAAGFAPFDDEVRYSPDAPRVDLGTLHLESGVVLAGSVVDFLGIGIADARISLLDVFVPELPGESRKDVLLGITDAEGRFRLSAISPGPWKLLIESPSHPSRIVEGTSLRPGLEASCLFTLEEGSEIAGRVLPSEGVEPADLGVEAVLSSPGGAPRPVVLDSVRTAPCAADGSFVLEGLPSGSPPARYDLRVVSRDPITGNRTAWISEPVEAHCGDRDVVLRALDPFLLRFWLADRDSGTLLLEMPKVSLALRSGISWLASEELEPGKELLQDAEGRFRAGSRLRVPEEANVALSIELAGYKRYVRTNLELHRGRVLDLGKIDMIPRPELAVRVLDEATDGPVGGAEVLLIAANRDALEDAQENELGTAVEVWQESYREEAKTDERGVAVLPFPEGVALLVGASHPSFARSRPTHVRNAEDRSEITIRLHAGSETIVHVLDPDGTHVSGMLVVQRDKTDPLMRDRPLLRMSVTGPDGTATFSHLTPGPHDYKLIDMPAFERTGDTVEVLVAAGAREQVTLMAPLFAELSGRVSKNDSPLPGAKLLAIPGDAGEPEASSDGVSVYSNTSGDYRFERLEVGTWTVLALASGRELAERRVVDVRPGRNTLDVEVATRTMRGKVTDVDGQPLHGVAVSACRPKERAGRIRDYLLSNGPPVGGDSSLWTTTDHDGAYSLQGVPTSGPIAILGFREGFAPSASTATTQPRVDLTMHGAGELKIDVSSMSQDATKLSLLYRIHAEFAGPADPLVAPERDARPDAEGTAVLHSLFPGPWLVSVVNPWERTVAAGPEHVDVTAGETAELVLIVP